MPILFSALLIALSELIGFVVAFIRTFVLNLKDRVDHSGYKIFVVGKVKSKAVEAKTWLNA